MKARIPENPNDPVSLRDEPVTDMMRVAGADFELANRLYVMLRKYFLETCDNVRGRLGVHDSQEGDYVPYLVFLNLLKREPKQWNDRKHIFACAAKGMEWYILNSKRRKCTVKRGGRVKTRSLSGSDIRDPNSPNIPAALEAKETLHRLFEKSPAHMLILRMRYEARKSNEEIAEILGISKNQVEYRLKKALRWVQQEASHDR